MARDDLLDDVHRALPRLKLWRRDMSSEPRLVVVEEAAVFDNRFRDRIKPARELFQRNLLIALDALDEAEVCRSQKSYVLAILPVNFFDSPGNDKLYTCGFFRIRR